MGDFEGLNVSESDQARIDALLDSLKGSSVVRFATTTLKEAVKHSCLGEVITIYEDCLNEHRDDKEKAFVEAFWAADEKCYDEFIDPAIQREKENREHAA